MVQQPKNRPDFPDTTSLDHKNSINALISALATWIQDNASEIAPNEAIAPAVEEIFVPYRLSYPDILRTWLDIHSKMGTDEACLLIEKIIEMNVLDYSESGDLVTQTH